MTHTTTCRRIGTLGTEKATQAEELLCGDTQYWKAQDLPAGVCGPQSPLSFPPSISPLCTHKKAFAPREGQGQESASVGFAGKQRKKEF